MSHLEKNDRQISEAHCTNAGIYNGYSNAIREHTRYALGWGLLSEFSPFRYFPHFPLLSKQTLAIEYHVYIWQVSPQLSCGDTCQIWMWFRESNRCFCKIENFAYGEISERSFSNPHPWSIAWAMIFPSIMVGERWQAISVVGWVSKLNCSVLTRRNETTPCQQRAIYTANRNV